MEARYLTDLEWRICHAINIYVYRNGMDGESPILVHIPPAKKKNMKTVLSAIQDRVSFPVGYPTDLYRMDGRRVRHPCELEQYNNYVVSSNYDKHFKCVQYGRKKSPLLVLNRDSKHIRVLRLQNSHYRDWMMKKEATVEERPFAPHFYPPYNTDNSSNTKLMGNEGSFGNHEQANSGLPQQKPFGSQQQAIPQDYIVQKCEVVTDNPQAYQTLLRLQDRLSIPFEDLISQFPHEPPNVPKTESCIIPKKQDVPMINQPVVKQVRSLPQTIVHSFDQYRLPPPPSEFLESELETDTMNSNFSNILNGNYVPNYVPDSPERSYENFRDIRSGLMSEGGSSSMPLESSSVSYEDLRAQNRYLIQRTKRKDRQLKKMMKKNSSLKMARRHASTDSDGSETDSYRYLYRTSKRGINYKSPRPRSYIVLPPPPPQFRDECVSTLPEYETAQAIERLEYIARYQNPP